MTPIELFLSKIAFSVLKNAIALPALKQALAVVSVMQAVAEVANCVQSINDCRDLGVCGLRVISGFLPETAIDQLRKVGSERIVFHRTEAGIYVASRTVQPFIATPADFPSFAATPADFPRISEA